MPIKKHVYRSPAEDEYIFNCLKNFPEERKKKLSSSDLAIFKNDSTIRQFIAKAPTERRDLLLAKGNFHVVKLYCDFNTEDPVTNLNYDKLYKQFKNVKARKEVIDEIQKKNMFAITTREMLNLGYLIAQNTHSPYFYINQDYNRVYNAIEEVNIKNLTDFDGEREIKKIKEADRSRKIVTALLYNFSQIDNYVKVTMKTDMCGLQILLYLFLNQDLYIHRNTLIKNLEYSPKLIMQRCFNFQSEGMIDTGRKQEDNRQYTIAERGIEMIAELLELMSSKAINY
jgi:hypothetical protein